MSNDSLGDRMKNYENSFRTHLPIRMPVIIRIDGKAFHTYTKKCKKPVDNGLVECMNDTAMFLCKNIQGCQLAYVQSDEISLLLNNYKELKTQAWFDNNIQKMVSVSASMAGVIFTMNSYKIWGIHDNAEGTGFEGMGYDSLITKPAFFDSRVFVLPKEEVVNYFIWRQDDAVRNSIQMLARTLYSHKECNNKNSPELQEMCHKKGINWNNCPTPQKRGRCIVKIQTFKKATDKMTGDAVSVQRSEWVVDNTIPIFTQNREYIESLVK